MYDESSSRDLQGRTLHEPSMHVAEVTQPVDNAKNGQPARQDDQPSHVLAVEQTLDKTFPHTSLAAETASNSRNDESMLAVDEGCDGGGSDPLLSDAASQGVRKRFLIVLNPRRMLSAGEVSGALGDLGTFLPDVVALSNVFGAGLPVVPVCFWSGAWSCFAGILFDIPMPIQPMHTVVAVCLTEGLTYAQLVAAGAWLGGILFVLGASGLIAPIQRRIPLACVRGLQLGLGLKVFGAGVRLVTKTQRWWGGAPNFDGMLSGLIASAIALVCYGRRSCPTSLILVGLGCVCAALSRPSLSMEFSSPVAAVPTMVWDDWWVALYRAALPQLPVTLLNSVVATAKLAEDLYPAKDVPANRIAMSVGFMDISTVWFGHFPSCHGCGGLAAQHAFGARTGSSMALMGLVKICLALFLGRSIIGALAAFPQSVVGVLLALSGIELAVPCRDMHGRADVVVMLLGAALVLSLGTGLAFVVSFVAALFLKLNPHMREAECGH